MQSSCDYSMLSYEVSHRLQEIKVDLEKAVDLMERDRPGVCDTLPLYILYVSWS